MRLGDANFFNLFALLASSGNPSRASHWRTGDVAWNRASHSHAGPHYSFRIEIHTLSRGGRGGWTLMMMQENWIDDHKRDPFRMGRWVHLSQGRRADVLAWFAARQAEMEAAR